MARPVKATRLQGNLIRGGFSLLSLAFERPSDRRRVAEFGDDFAEAAEDGLSIELDAKSDRAGIAIRRHRKSSTTKRRTKLKGGRS